MPTPEGLLEGRDLLGLYANTETATSGMDGLLSAADKSFIDRIRNVNTYTTTGTIDDDTFLVLLDASSGDVTLTLPLAAASGAGKTHSLIVKRVDDSSNDAFIQRNTSDTIEGETIISVGSGYSLPLESDGSTAWYIS